MVLCSSAVGGKTGFVAAGPSYIESFLIYVSGIVQPNMLQEYALGASV
jgi:hypothetical protein